MIVARNNGDKACNQTILEKWLMDDKLVIILTDEDIEKMLIEKSNQGMPEILIRQKIEDFLLSI